MAAATADAVGATGGASTADTVSVNCRAFRVDATDEATIASGGTLDLESAAEMHLTADSDLKAISPMIWLN